MTRWLERSLVPVHQCVSGLAVLLDPDSLVQPGDVEGEVVEVHDWWTLRAAYERDGRRRSPALARVVLLIRGDLAGAQLPWDIERSAERVVSIRYPGPPPIRRALADLDGEEEDRAIAAVQAGSNNPVGAILTAIAGVPIGNDALGRADQLRLAARIVLRPTRSDAVVDLARSRIDDPAIVGLLADPPALSALQAHWNEFADGRSTPWDSIFATARFELGQLFAAQLLEPIVGAGATPPWASFGRRRPTDEERAIALLDDSPILSVPEDSAGWCAAAEWWGDVRRLVANAPHELRESAWLRWSELNTAFLPWLRKRYGSVLSSAAPWPSGLHRVAPFLARRLREGEAQRVLLVVLDGLGHAQWRHLSERLTLTSVTSGSTFAMVPTYTTVSRQAVFAGDLPTSFADSLWTTHAERRRWESFWAGQGLDVRATAYHRVKGRLPHDVIDFGAARAVGIVVNAVDDLMHTSELFGDAQLLANLDVWTANGFLDDLVRRASDASFEVWITADHGNLECQRAGALSEGLAVESAGKRLLRYPNPTLRQASAAEGIIWDGVPGLPPDAGALQFAPDRLAYTNHLLSISHGGLSIDEVIVPLVRVAA